MLRRSKVLDPGLQCGPSLPGWQQFTPCSCWLWLCGWSLWFDFFDHKYHQFFLALEVALGIMCHSPVSSWVFLLVVHRYEATGLILRINARVLWLPKDTPGFRLLGYGDKFSIFSFFPMAFLCLIVSCFPDKFKNSYQNHGTFEMLPTLFWLPLQPFPNCSVVDGCNLSAASLLVIVSRG